MSSCISLGHPERLPFHHSIFHLFYLEGLDICSICDSNFHEVGMKVIFMLALADFQGKIGLYFIADYEQVTPRSTAKACSGKAANLCVLPECPLSRHGNFRFHV
jgi:hypothetical protein